MVRWGYDDHDGDDEDYIGDYYDDVVDDISYWYSGFVFLDKDDFDNVSPIRE